MFTVPSWCTEANTLGAVERRMDHRLIQPDTERCRTRSNDAEDALWL